MLGIAGSWMPARRLSRWVAWGHYLGWEADTPRERCVGRGRTGCGRRCRWPAGGHSVNCCLFSGSAFPTWAVLPHRNLCAPRSGSALLEMNKEVRKWDEPAVVGPEAHSLCTTPTYTLPLFHLTLKMPLTPSSTQQDQACFCVALPDL